MAERVLAGLEPERVFYYFEEITQIPHPSYHEKAISDYLVAFAKDHKLEWQQDEHNNVIIIRPATAGYENEEPLIIQGHMDMVCEKEVDCDKDMEKEGLDLVVDGDLVCAKGTTLGGDDGIAVAYALALLEDESLEAPRLEFVCTTSEETGMEGAHHIDLSICKGKRFLNIDSEEEGTVLASCAGGGRLVVRLGVVRETASGVRFSIVVDGLLGGHSGGEIDKGRANADMLMARVLRRLAQETEVRLAAFAGGEKDNAIPRRAVAEIVVADEAAGDVEKWVAEEEEKIVEEFGSADPDIRIDVKRVGGTVASGSSVVNSSAGTEDLMGADGSVSDGSSVGNGLDGGNDDIGVLTVEDTAAVIRLMLSLPNGVVRMSDHIEGLVETSLNLGILKLGDDTFSMTYALRSSVAAAYEALRENMRFVAESCGAEVEVRSEYPAWQFVEESPLREKMAAIYREQTGQELKVEAIHAGLECGIFAEKIDGIDAVSFGPDMWDIHTPKERVSVSSVERVYRLLREVVSRKG